MPETVVRQGTGALLDASHRWGDYGSMAIDPIDGWCVRSHDDLTRSGCLQSIITPALLNVHTINHSTLYFVHAYVGATGPAGWRTFVSSFRFPNCDETEEEVKALEGPVKESGSVASSLVGSTQETVTAAPTPHADWTPSYYDDDGYGGGARDVSSLFSPKVRGKV